MLLNLLLTKWLVFTLVLIRVSGLVGFAPVFGSTMLPRRVKIALAVLLAMIVYPLVPLAETVLPQTLDQFVMAAFKELAIGVTIGFVANLVFIGVQMAGQMVGMQMGFAIANVLNPMTQSEQSVIGQFYFFFAIAVFVVIDGPGMLVRVMAHSFETIPIGNFTLDANVFEVVARSTQSIFTTGIKIAAPMIVALFMVLTGMGFVARTVPQFNILVVGFSLSIGMGLFMMLVSMATVGYVIAKLLNHVVAFELPDLVTLIAGG